MLFLVGTTLEAYFYKKKKKKKKKCISFEYLSCVETVYVLEGRLYVFEPHLGAISWCLHTLVSNDDLNNLSCLNL